MQSYVDTGDMAPLTLFYSGPAHWNFTNLISSYYGSGGTTPAFFVDEVFDRTGWNEASCQNAINSRLTEPAYLDIDVSVGGDETNGVIYYNITAEQDLEPGGMVRIYTVIFENDVYAGSGWGVYTGKTLNWIPRMAPLGLMGIELEFDGPYPQTVSAIGEYTIEAGWEWENLGVMAFVMDYSDKQVYNAYYNEDLGSIMGIESGGEATAMTVGPNPSNGTFSVICSLPDGLSGSIEVFDVTGRMIGSANSSSADFTVEETGLYLVRLTSSEGETVTRSVAVTR